MVQSGAQSEELLLKAPALESDSQWWEQEELPVSKVIFVDVDLCARSH